MSTSDDLICSECSDDLAVEGHRLCLDCLEEVEHEHEWRPRPGESVVDEVLGVQIEECHCGEERHRGAGPLREVGGGIGPCLCAIHRQDYELQGSWWLQESDVVAAGGDLRSLRPRLLLHPVTLAKLYAPEDPSAWLAVALERLVREACYRLDLVEDRIAQDMARRERAREGATFLDELLRPLDDADLRRMASRITPSALELLEVRGEAIMSGKITTEPILFRLEEGRDRG